MEWILRTEEVSKTYNAGELALYFRRSTCYRNTQ